MTTDLDRLLGWIPSNLQNHPEVISLKSQIESKLAQVDNPSWCPICQGRGFVPEGFYSTTTGQWSSTSTLTEKCRSCNGLGIIQNSNQELSQLREEIKKKDYEALVYCKSTEKLVNAIKNRMESLDSDNTRYSDELYFELQNLLKESEK